jgi:hypothetical protein
MYIMFFQTPEPEYLGQIIKTGQVQVPDSGRHFRDRAKRIHA